MRVYKDKQYLIFDYEDGRIVKYNFASKQSIGLNKKPVKNLSNQLRGFTLEQLFNCCNDEKYAKFLRFVKVSEPYEIRNIGTILDRVPKYARFEQIFSAGIDDIIDSLECSNFQYSINEIPKSLIKLCRKYNFKLSNRVIKYYKENPDAYHIAYNLDYNSLITDDIFTVWNTQEEKFIREKGWVYSSYFNKLVNEYGYNAKSLWLYLDRVKTFEAVDNMSFLIKELYDYANMMKQLSSKYDKFPRNFLTTFQIACRNYNRMKREFPEDLFQKRINKQYECTFGNYVFIYPNSTQDIKDEAVQMSNCLASYIEKVIDGKCHILFLREKNNPDKSLVTVEVVNGHVVQAKRRFNNDITDEDRKVIDAFNKRFGKLR